MTLTEALKQLKSLANEKMRAHNAKNGAGDKQFGVKHGDIRVLAKKIKTDHKLALSLWETGNIDAQYLAILIMKPTELSAKELDRLVHSVTFAWVADWLHSYVVKLHPDKETLRQVWMKTKHRWAAREGWALTAGRVVKSPEGLDPDPSGLLDRIESEMGSADPVVPWTMNNTSPKSASTSPNSASEPSPSVKRSASITTGPCQRAARHLTRRSGSISW